MSGRNCEICRSIIEAATAAVYAKMPKGFKRVDQVSIVKESLESLKNKKDECGGRCLDNDVVLGVKTLSYQG